MHDLIQDPVVASDGVSYEHAALTRRRPYIHLEACSHTPSHMYPHFSHLQDLMQDPVVASDGFSYERAAMEKWLGTHSSSPLTNLPLTHKVCDRLCRSEI